MNIINNNELKNKKIKELWLWDKNKNGKYDNIYDYIILPIFEIYPNAQIVNHFKETNKSLDEFVKKNRNLLEQDECIYLFITNVIEKNELKKLNGINNLIPLSYYTRDVNFVRKDNGKTYLYLFEYEHVEYEYTYSLGTFIWDIFGGNIFGEKSECIFKYWLFELNTIEEKENIA